MRIQSVLQNLFSFITLAGVLAAGCAPPAPDTDDENAGGVQSAEQSGLLGTWIYESGMGSSPGMVALGFGPDGRFFGRFEANCAGPPDPVRSHLRGSYQLLPDGGLALATDLGDAGPLSNDCKALLHAHLSGTFSMKLDSGRLVLEKALPGARVHHQLKRIDSYCMQTEDCAVVASPRDGCELSFECNRSANRCTTVCTPPIQPGALRVRVPSPMPADGTTMVPIFVDTKDIALEQSPFVLTLSRANAGTIGRSKVRIGKTGFLQGWRTGWNPTTTFMPCDAAQDPSCVGPVTLTLTLEGHTEPLAETTIDLVPKSEDLPGTACLVGGNIMEIEYLTTVALSTISNVHSTDVAGRFSGSMGLNNGVEFAYLDFDSKFSGNAGIEITGHGIEPGLYDVSIGADTPEKGITMTGGTNGSAFSTPAQGRVRIIELTTTNPAAKSAPIARATIAWEFTSYLGTTATGTKPVRFDGCVHYDRDTPPFDCGDGILQLGEQCDDGNNVDHDGCSATCKNEPPPPAAPPPSASPPASWTCDPAYYNEGEGAYTYCDCGCGAPDPDCALGVSVFGCDVGQTCDSAGHCQ